jgi:N-carbamoyl-L-amino-acid hydrolase
MVGSHSDTVPSGGRFDGILGVLAGLEVVQTLRDNGLTLNHDFELVDFLAEEPSEFGLSCIGSKAMAGLLEPYHLKLEDGTGRTLGQAIKEVGGNPDRLDTARRAKDSITAYVELHIEQAKTLEASDTPIGVVTDIAAIRRENICVRGQTDHAGATPMRFRKDALVTASKMVLATEEMTLQACESGPQIVATVGSLSVSPNAANAVPGEIRFTLEIRCGDDEKLRAHTECLLAKFLNIAENRGNNVEIESVSCGLATKSSEHVMEAIETAAENSGLSSTRLSSGAGHDAVYASYLGPMAMIFIPCLNGRSHTPDEWATKQQCGDGAQAMIGAILELDTS